VSYAIGSLVRARGREWVVLPQSTDDLLLVRPLGGTDDEVTGIYLPLEGDHVASAEFALPDPDQPGDYRSSRLLRDAVRLGFRSSAGPFRSFGHLGVDPRPYQLVPLLMALKLDPVRLLIADDVGIGKTIEAALVARELLDRGEVRRLAVLCPPALAEQWQAELRAKFHIEAVTVLPGTVSRLERDIALSESLFDRYPYVIVSTDFIKSERRRAEFLRTCPELVIVDEAHTCASGGSARSSQHQRHQLIVGLARSRDRHLLLVTATPHSGNEAAFRSLLALLDPAFEALPEELAGEARRAERQRLAAHMVQRRRADIRAYLDTTTVFPEREERPDLGYKLTPAYRALLEDVLRYARESVATVDAGRPHFRRRIRWWSALALLRAIASSPAAAAATLRTRAATADAASDDEADEIGRRTVLDLGDDTNLEGMDVAPGADDADDADEYDEDESAPAGTHGDQRRHRVRLLRMAAAADALRGEADAKLQQAGALVRDLVRDGFAPIVFCRFIPTAEYVKDDLRARLPKDITIEAVTGLLPPAEREARVAALGEATKRVLVCTDCLSEGINLQDHFDAVVHYDLSWNPTRHEQREGRVDRYGQSSPTVRVVTLYGLDNQIDGLVLDVLLRKHRAIRGKLGISVPVPADTNQVIEAIFEGLLLLERQAAPEIAQARLPGLEAYWKPQAEALYGQWEAVAERERRSRSLFAQETIKPQEVAEELDAMRAAAGSSAEVAAFVRAALRAHGGTVSDGLPAHVDPSATPQALRDAIGTSQPFAARFDLPVRDGERYLSRTDPLVEGLAAYVMDAALDAQGDALARRCGVIRTARVRERTTLLLLRLRYHLTTQPPGAPATTLLAEECQLAAFTGVPAQARWLASEEAEALLAATPDQNVPPDIAASFLRRAVADFAPLQPALEDLAQRRAAELLAAHRRVRTAARLRGVSQTVAPQLPPDVLGLYIYLPVIGGA
jgi:superfamily II DNA or RNA helicase